MFLGSVDMVVNLNGSNEYFFVMFNMFVPNFVQPFQKQTIQPTTWHHSEDNILWLTNWKAMYQHCFLTLDFDLIVNKTKTHFKHVEIEKRFGFAHWITNMNICNGSCCFETSFFWLICILFFWKKHFQIYILKLVLSNLEIWIFNGKRYFEFRTTNSKFWV